MGRHTAADGASQDPLVAAAIAQRPTEGGAHSAERSAPLGWPGPEPDPESALGWPGDLARES